MSDTQSEVWIPDHDFDDHEAEAIQWLQVIAAQLARIANAVEAGALGVKVEQWPTDQVGRRSVVRPTNGGTATGEPCRSWSRVGTHAAPVR